MSTANDVVSTEPKLIETLVSDIAQASAQESPVATTFTRLVDMFRLQEKMNTLVNPDWKKAGYNFMNAVMVEAVEAFDHTAWKWWKSVDAQPDWNQVRLELVDIWHFVLSEMIMQGWTNEIAIMNIASSIDGLSFEAAAEDKVRFQEAIKEVALEAIMDRRTALNRMVSGLVVASFFANLPFTEVYRLYLLKNTLNIFRQENGDKEGTYPRKWGDKEDNEVLTSIVGDMPIEEINFNKVYTMLRVEYLKVKTNG